MVKANFHQSTFYSSVNDLDQIKRRSADFIPKIDASAQVDQFGLSQIDGQQTLGQIADALMASFPERFTNHKDGLAYIAELAESYRTNSA